MAAVGERSKQVFEACTGNQAARDFRYSLFIIFVKNDHSIGRVENCKPFGNTFDGVLQESPGFDCFLLRENMGGNIGNRPTIAGKVMP